jgi:hypothetical protein
MAESSSNPPQPNDPNPKQHAVPPVAQMRPAGQPNSANQATASQNPYAVPSTPSQQQYQYQDQQGDATGGLIPYKNPPALIGYYLGYLGLLPIIGIPFAIAAIVLGIIGLKKKKRNPIVRGTGHAIFAIVAGLIGLTCSTGIALLFVVDSVGFRP